MLDPTTVAIYWRFTLKAVPGYQFGGPIDAAFILPTFLSQLSIPNLKNSGRKHSLALKQCWWRSKHQTSCTRINNMFWPINLMHLSL
jgi:hypothetical protein